MDRWISVEDMLPAIIESTVVSKDVLVCFQPEGAGKNEDVRIGNFRYDRMEWDVPFHQVFKVNFWMPLPSPPKEPTDG